MINFLMTDTWVGKEKFDLRILYSLQILPMPAKERGNAGSRDLSPKESGITNVPFS